MQGRKRRQGRRTTLIEDIVRQDRVCSVDRDSYVVRDAKVIGFTSSNEKGRYYTPNALRRAVPLYEGASVYCDHPRDANGNIKPRMNRNPRDAMGSLHNVRFVEGDGLRADWHLFKGHSMSAVVLEAAENPKLLNTFGLSHNADGDGYDENSGRWVCEEITELRSVDLVTKPATTKNLVESKEAKAMAKNKAKSVTEVGDDDLYEPAVGGDDAAMDGDHMDDLFAAFKKLAASDPEKANKVLAMLKAEVSGSASDETATEAEGDDDKKDDDMDDKKDKTESRVEVEKPAVKALTEDRVKQYCDLAGVTPDKELTEAMLSMSDENAALSLLKWAKTRTAKPAGQAPRSQGPNTGTRTKAVTNAADFVSAITIN